LNIVVAGDPKDFKVFKVIKVFKVFNDVKDFTLQIIQNSKFQIQN